MKSAWKLSGAGWWIAAVVILISRLSMQAREAVDIVAPLHEGLLTESTAWDVPVHGLLPSSDMLWIPGWAGAVLSATLIWWLASIRTGRLSNLLTAGMVVTAALVAAPEQIVIAALVATTARLSCNPHAWANPLRAIPMVGGVLVVSGVLSLDFGFVVLLLLSSSLASMIRRDTNDLRSTAVRMVPALVILAALVTACWVSRPYFHAMMRPLSALWFGLDPRVFPELTSPLKLPHLWPGCIALMLLTVLVFRRRTNASTLSMNAVAGAAVLCLTGLSSEYCLWPCLAGLWSLAAGGYESRAARHAPQKTSHWLQFACVAIAAAYFTWTSRELGLIPVWSTLPPRVVDTSSWQVEGPVLLTQPGMANDWKGSLAPARTTLLLDDRWDADAEAALTLAQISHSILDGRRDRHLLADGSWGGHSDFESRWQPALVVVDSAELVAIRQLAQDPKWSVLAIDSVRTVFGNADVPSTRPQAGRSADLYFFLEWPNPGRQVTPEGTLQLGTPADSRRIAAVFLAMRLPYAALRVLPNDEHPETRQLKAWCYTELALRSLHQSGRRSLLDQYRALAEIRKLEDSLWLTANQRSRLDGHRAAISDSTTEVMKSIKATSHLTEAELQVRDALLNGDSAEAREVISQITSNELRSAYASIASADRLTTKEVFDSLSAAIRNKPLPDALKEELCFYLGCLAIELGDAAQAIGFLKESEILNPDSPLRALRSLYLRGLGFTGN